MTRTARVMRHLAGSLGVLVLVLVTAGPAPARVGGGGSSGSRGSRSYSAPRTPSSPVSPAPRPSTPAPLSPAPSRPGGLFGGWGGMLGGLVVGGLLGSLLFGHGGMGMGGGGGIGLLDILLLAGLAALVISFLRRRQAQPAAPAGYAGGDWASRGAEPVEVAAAPAAAPAADGHITGVAAIQMMDPAFDPPRFAAIATDLFTRLQIGWSAGDLAAVRAQLTDEMAVALEEDLARLKARHRVNRVEQVKVDAAEVTEAWQEYGRDLVTVRLKAGVVDYTLDEATGAVVEGSRTASTTFEEYWTFVRPVGPNPWRVSAIQQPPA